ncbi:hypothetical protein DFQ26_005143 [Actinomortierella ambigua]|nr:hypothetical protein DFQ26_005143 [Actinomortierella ambigua]
MAPVTTTTAACRQPLLDLGSSPMGPHGEGDVVHFTSISIPSGENRSIDNEVQAPSPAIKSALTATVSESVSTRSSRHKQHLPGSMMEERHRPSTTAAAAAEDDVPPYTSRELDIAYSMVTPRKSDHVHPLDEEEQEGEGQEEVSQSKQAQGRHA